jgi:hypothetical protein
MKITRYEDATGHAGSTHIEDDFLSYDDGVTSLG